MLVRKANVKDIVNLKKKVFSLKKTKECNDQGALLVFLLIRLG